MNMRGNRTNTRKKTWCSIVKKFKTHIALYISKCETNFKIIVLETAIKINNNGIVVFDFVKVVKSNYSFISRKK